MATDMGELTDLLGACMDVHLAITAALTGRMPATLCGILSGVAQSFDSLETLADAVEAQLRTFNSNSRFHYAAIADLALITNDGERTDADVLA